MPNNDDKFIHELKTFFQRISSEISLIREDMELASKISKEREIEHLKTKGEFIWRIFSHLIMAGAGALFVFALKLYR